MAKQRRMFTRKEEEENVGSDVAVISRWQNMRDVLSLSQYPTLNISFPVGGTSGLAGSGLISQIANASMNNGRTSYYSLPSHRVYSVMGHRFSITPDPILGAMNTLSTSNSNEQEEDTK